MTRFCFQPPSWANRRAGTFAPLCDARRMQGASWIKVVSKPPAASRILTANHDICFSTVGLIYVNPGGPSNAPHQPEASAKNIRSPGNFKSFFASKLIESFTHIGSAGISLDA